MSIQICKKNNWRHNTSGFTIVETLVAITILMIAVSGPLVIATKSLNSARISKNQMIASYLAQESMEMVKNVRDGNMSEGSNWLDGLGAGELTPKCYDQSHVCDINGIDLTLSGDVEVSECPLSPGVLGCPIYFNQGTGYSHKTTGVKTAFSRHFYLADIAGSNPPERLVHVVVDWMEGTVSYQVHITSQMVQVSR